MKRHVVKRVPTSEYRGPALQSEVCHLCGRKSTVGETEIREPNEHAPFGAFSWVGVLVPRPGTSRSRDAYWRKKLQVLRKEWKKSYREVRSHRYI